MRRWFATLGLIGALIGSVLIFGDPASASPCNISGTPGWSTVSNGGYSGYVPVPGPDKFRGVCWIVETRNYSSDGYGMVVKIQDTVDSQEPDSDGWIEAHYASPGNMVWHNDWPGQASIPKDVNSADWNGFTSLQITGSRGRDGPPEAWHVQFWVVATGTGGVRALVPITLAF